MGLVNYIGHGPMGVDTVIFIYFIKEHPQFLRLIEPLFREVDQGRLELITSALSLQEVLVVPCRIHTGTNWRSTLVCRLTI